MKERITFIIQARLASTRMPAKIVQPFFKEKSIIELMLDKLKGFPQCDIIVATSKDKSNDPLAQIVENSGVQCFRGSEDDVLQRFIDAAEMTGAKRIIRVCSDNPFLEEHAILRLLEHGSQTDAEYVSFLVNGTPSIKTHFGFWTEYVTIDALKEVRSLTSEKLYHEHVTNYIYTHPEQFKIEWLSTPACIENRTDIRLTCDTPIDFANIKSIYETLISQNPHPRIEDIVAFLDNHPNYLQQMKAEIEKNSK